MILYYVYSAEAQLLADTFSTRLMLPCGGMVHMFVFILPLLSLSIVRVVWLGSFALRLAQKLRLNADLVVMKFPPHILSILHDLNDVMHGNPVHGE